MKKNERSFDPGFLALACLWMGCAAGDPSDSTSVGPEGPFAAEESDGEPASGSSPEGADSASSTGEPPSDPTMGDATTGEPGGDEDDDGGASPVFEEALDGAQIVYDVHPSLWPQGAIDLESFLDATPWTTGKSFITETRWWHETSPTGEPMLRFLDPRIEDGQQRNPWFRRFDLGNDWGETDLFDAVGIDDDKGEVIVAEMGLYFPRHEFTGTEADEATWSPGRHVKWLLGARGSTGVGATGGNPQDDGIFEVVFTTYGSLIADHGQNTKGDFRGPTDWDWDGEHEPPHSDYAETEYYRTRGNMGIGIYAHDPGLVNNYQEMIYPTYPGTSTRRTYGPDTFYEHRFVIRLNTPGEFDGEFYWEIREDGGPWTIARHLTDVDWRGDSEVKFRNAGLLFFAGGSGSGWSFGDDDGYAPGAYDRGFYLAYSRLWTK